MAEKKSFVLRISPELFEALQRIAEQEFRSVNGQMEMILTEYVRRRGRPAPELEGSPAPGKKKPRS